LSTVSIMPGIDSRAPERTETRSGLAPIAQALAGLGLDGPQRSSAWSHIPSVEALAGSVVGVARFGRDGETWWNGESCSGHLRAAGALATEQVAHVGRPPPRSDTPNFLVVVGVVGGRLCLSHDSRVLPICVPSHKYREYRATSTGRLLALRTPRSLPVRAIECARRASLQLFHGHSNLRHRVAVPHGNRVVLQALKVDRQTIGRTDLVLPAVTPADRGGLVVGDHVMAPQHLVNVLRERHQRRAVAQQRQYRRLVRRERRVQVQDDARVFLVALGNLFLVVGVRARTPSVLRSAPADGSINLGQDVLARLLVEVAQLFAAELLVLGEIEIAPIGNALQLPPAEGERYSTSTQARA